MGAIRGGYSRGNWGGYEPALPPTDASRECISQPPAPSSYGSHGTQRGTTCSGPTHCRIVAWGQPLRGYPLLSIEIGVVLSQAPWPPLTSGFVLVSFTGKFADILGSIG